MALGLHLASDYGTMRNPTIDGVELSTDVAHGDILLNAAGVPSAVVIGSFQSAGVEPWNVHGVHMYIAVGLASTREANWGTAAFSTAAIVGWSGPYLATSQTTADANGDYLSIRTLEENIDRTLPNDTRDSNTLTGMLVAGQLVNAARRANIEGIPMSIPRPSIAARVAQWGSRIDVLDPTAATYPARKMSTGGFGSAYPQMICSARYDSSYMFTIRDMNRLRNGNIWSSSTQMGLCPMAEILV